MKPMRAVLVALPFVMPAVVASAEEPIRMAYDAKQAFDETDTNHDGLVDPPEFYERITETFFHGDADKNGKLEKGEYEAVVVIETDFDAVDRDRDGVVTLIEFFRARGEVFDQVDSNADGALSEQEVIAGFEAPPKPQAEPK
jgi:Ca2+-binding EF-hand superfamily protein